MTPCSVPSILIQQLLPFIFNIKTLISFLLPAAAPGAELASAVHERLLELGLLGPTEPQSQTVGQHKQEVGVTNIRYHAVTIMGHHALPSCVTMRCHALPSCVAMLYRHALPCGYHHAFTVRYHHALPCGYHHAVPCLTI